MNKAKDLKKGLQSQKIQFTPLEGYFSVSEEERLTRAREKQLGGKPGGGRPRTSNKVITEGNTPERGTKQGERRATYILKIEVIEKIKKIANLESYRETLNSQENAVVMVKDIVGKALQDFIDRYEKKNGVITLKNK